MAGLSRADGPEGQIIHRVATIFVSGMEEASLCLEICHEAHTLIRTLKHTRAHGGFMETHPHIVYRIYLRVGYAARKLISEIAGLAN